MKLLRLIALGSLAWGLGSAAWPETDLPPLQHSGNITYLSGGIGLDESTAIRAAAGDFTLSVLFVQNKRGEYLADVKLRVLDRAGKTVLETLAEGPMLLARLPAGEYQLLAEHAGKTLSKKVTVGSKGTARASFVWQPTAGATID